METKHDLLIQNKRDIQFKFTIRRKLTFIRGNSATGKTTLFQMVSDANSTRISGVTPAAERHNSSCGCAHPVILNIQLFDQFQCLRHILHQFVPAHFPVFQRFYQLVIVLRSSGHDEVSSRLYDQVYFWVRVLLVCRHCVSYQPVRHHDAGIPQLRPQIIQGQLLHFRRMLSI